MNRVKHLLCLPLAALTMFAHAAADPAYQGDAAKGKAIAATVCIACHGADGNSPLADNPNIAGQNAAYLLKQMRELKPDANGQAVRVNAVMNAMIAAYTDNQLKDLAAYFSMQASAITEAKSSESIKLGEKVYRAGVASKGLPSCAACHGPTGAGMPSQFPRISGQHAKYTEAQLNAFRLGQRNNDPNGMMRDLAERMTDAEIRAVSDYIAGLN